MPFVKNWAKKVKIFEQKFCFGNFSFKNKFITLFENIGSNFMSLLGQLSLGLSKIFLIVTRS